MTIILPQLPAHLAQVRTTVVCVRGLDPTVWRADPVNLYVGRGMTLRSGKYAGVKWPNSGWGNPYKLPRNPDKWDKLNCIVQFCEWLKGPHGAELRRALPHLHGRRLGCWCCDWDGKTYPRPMCHAAVYADWANRLTFGERWETLE